MTVVEPRVTFSNSSTPVAGDAADVVTVTVRMQNPTVANGVTAFDTRVSYTLPTGKMTAVSGSYAAGTCPTASANTARANAR